MGPRHRQEQGESVAPKAAAAVILWSNAAGNWRGRRALECLPSAPRRSRWHCRSGRHNGGLRPSRPRWRGHSITTPRLSSAVLCCSESTVESTPVYWIQPMTAQSVTPRPMHQSAASNCRAGQSAIQYKRNERGGHQHQGFEQAVGRPDSKAGRQQRRRRKKPNPAKKAARERRKDSPFGNRHFTRVTAARIIRVGLSNRKQAIGREPGRITNNPDPRWPDKGTSRPAAPPGNKRQRPHPASIRASFK